MVSRIGKQSFADVLESIDAGNITEKPVSDEAVVNYLFQQMVGTVSESGGVPTGAIIERGSNANGEYVRFADGTQIATTQVTGIDLSVFRNNAYYQSDFHYYTSPISFYIIDYQNATDSSSSRVWGAAAGSGGNVILNYHTSLTNRTANIVIIGRWY